MEEIINYSKQCFYLNLVCFLIAGVGSIIKFSTQKNLGVKLVRIYMSAYAIWQVLYIIEVYILKGTTSANDLNIALMILEDLGFTLFEFIVFAFIIYSSIRQISLKLLILCLAGIFLVVASYLVIKDVKTLKLISLESLHNIYTIQAIVLILISILYYYELWRFPTSSLLHNEFSFWAITGISFLAVCTLPLSFFLNYLLEFNFATYAKLYSIFYVFYILLFLMLIKGLKCKKTVII